MGFVSLYDTNPVLDVVIKNFPAQHSERIIRIMNHSFIFQEGMWKATGTFTNSENHTFPAEGQSQVVHNGNEWILNSRLTVSDGENGNEFINRYQIQPVTGKSQTTKWISNNTTLGDFLGLFAIIGDVILSTFSTDNHQYTGLEYVIREDETTYNTRGVLLEEKQKISSWAVTLKRMD